MKFFDIYGKVAVLGLVLCALGSTHSEAAYSRRFSFRNSRTTTTTEPPPPYDELYPDPPSYSELYPPVDYIRHDRTNENDTRRPVNDARRHGNDANQERSNSSRHNLHSSRERNDHSQRNNDHSSSASNSSYQRRYVSGERNSQSLLRSLHLRKKNKLSPQWEVPEYVTIDRTSEYGNATPRSREGDSRRPMSFASTGANGGSLQTNNHHRATEREPHTNGRGNAQRRHVSAYEYALLQSNLRPTNSTRNNRNKSSHNRDRERHSDSRNSRSRSSWWF